MPFNSYLGGNGQPSRRLRPAGQTNDTCRDGRGLLYIADRWGGGMHILEQRG